MANKMDKVNGVYIFGAGAHGRIFFDIFQTLNIAVEAFIDDYASANTYLGRPLLRSSEVEDKGTAVYISVGLVSDRIRTDLISWGFSHVHDFTQSLLAHPELIHGLKRHSLWYSDTTAEMINPDAIEQFRSFLADEKSRELLDRIVAFRRDFRAEHYIEPDHRVQYFPDDIDLFRSVNSLRFVDAGAFIGDTLKIVGRECRKRDLPLDYCCCFEPDPTSLAKLQQCADSLATDDGRVFIYPAGVWERSELLNFAADQSASSRVLAAGMESSAAQSIFGLAIDDCLYSAAPNYIKMDVEGAERQALMGAKRTIECYRPLLAVCLYHRPGDLWELPLLINEMAPGYDMYLRVYGDMLLETVLYCVPQPAACSQTL